ncbi:MAG: DNA polymerase I [Lentimicrobiaceae bacterium]|nr:DNA polymerase I [Lentimicrobiaceae bacterium]
MQEKKLFLLDAMALIYRAYFALNKNPRITSKGLNTSAILGFANTLLELLKKEKPTHLGVAFDTMAPTARHLEYTEYKANRPPLPDDIAVSIPYIKRLLQGMNIPILYADGYEADDVIGTLSKKAEKQGYTVYMVTPDKDFGQLVSEHIYIYKPARMGNDIEILGPKEVCEKFGIQNPLQVIDMLGLWGDAADNIPGIPGVGEVTARKLLAQFGSVENLIEKAAEIENPKLREKVQQNVGQALESKMLATIILDAPVEFNPQELQLCPPDSAAVFSLLDELEMRHLSTRISSYYRDWNAPASSPQKQQSATPQLFSTSATPATPAPRSKTGTNKPQDTTLDLFDPQNLPESKPVICHTKDDADVALWANEAALKAGLEKLLEEQTPVSFYLCSGKANHIRQAKSLCIAFCRHQPQNAPHSPAAFYYLPVFSPEETAALQAFFSAARTFGNLVCHDLKTQLHLLKNMGVEADFEAFDTLLAHYLIDPESPHDLPRLTANYLPYSYSENLFGGGLSATDEDIRYSIQNAKLVLELYYRLQPDLERAGAQKLFSEVEIPLCRVLCLMERAGVKLDRLRLAQYGKELQEQIGKIEQEIYSLSGQVFNIASPKQLGEVLFDKLQIVEKPKHTKTKQYSTAEDVLQKLVNKHPIVEKVLQYRSLTKLKTTYVDALPALADAKTDKIHTTYNQAVTATGRLSSQNPNLQNIPIRTELGKEIRRCFVPSQPQNRLLAADYSQIELRIIAHLSGDKTMLADFSRHKDIHTATAANVFGVLPEEVTPEMRRKAKSVNFGIVYGMSAFGLADRLQIPRREAADLIERYYANYPGLKNYIEKALDEARQKGYTETLLHRRRYIKDINSSNSTVRGYAERNAINAPVQGSSADMIKVAMIAVQKRIEEEKLSARMILQVHDELVFDVPQNEIEKLSQIVNKEMKNALPMSVPVEVEINCADNWLDAH